MVWTDTASIAESDNIGGDGDTGDPPDLNFAGDKPSPYYRANASDADVVDAGVDVGLFYYGSVPDMGRYEWGGNTLVMVTGSIIWAMLGLSLLTNTCLFLTLIAIKRRMRERIKEYEEKSVMIERFFHDKYYREAWFEMWGFSKG